MSPIGLEEARAEMVGRSFSRTAEMPRKRAAAAPQAVPGRYALHGAILAIAAIDSTVSVLR
jgi:hypothetical protein